MRLLITPSIKVGVVRGPSSEVIARVPSDCAAVKAVHGINTAEARRVTELQRKANVSPSCSDQLRSMESSICCAR